MEVSENSPQPEFQFEDPNQELNSRGEMEKQTIIVSTQGNTISIPTSHVVVTSTNSHYTLSHTKAIDLIGEEFVSKLKSEPEQDEENRPTVVMSIAGSSDTTTVTAGGEQSHLVYCNLSDLDLSASNETYSLASLHSLAEASSTVQQQERNPYSAVSTILLQGGILQVRDNIRCYINGTKCI